MGVTVSMLASGSRGNCAIVASARTKILVDAGISGRETFKRMKSLGDDPRSLSAILITHEHCDHIYGLATLAKKLGIPVFMTGATHQAWSRAVRDQVGDAVAQDRNAAHRQHRLGAVGTEPAESRRQPGAQDQRTAILP